MPRRSNQVGALSPRSCHGESVLVPLRPIDPHEVCCGPGSDEVASVLEDFQRSTLENGFLDWDKQLPFLRSARAEIAALIGAEAEEICFTPSLYTATCAVMDVLTSQKDWGLGSCILLL